MSRNAFNSEEQTNLQHLSAMLHLFHHRNKNQHRHSLWWRHFSVFRRQLNNLVKDTVQLNATPASHIARTKKKFRDPQVQTRIRERLTFWQEVLVPRWQRAFSQTTADKRFAVLGLVLLAVLAEVCATTGVTTAFEDLAQTEVEQVLEKFAKEQWRPDSLGPEQGAEVEDVGEAVRRNQDGVVGTTAVQSLELSTATDLEDRSTNTVKKEATVQSKPLNRSISKVTKNNSIATHQVKKKKRRKGGNAIDDLFAGF
nr:ribonuclease mrp protein subunit rmp1 [Quercus suber]